MLAAHDEEPGRPQPDHHRGTAKRQKREITVSRTPPEHRIIPQYACNAVCAPELPALFLRYRPRIHPPPGRFVGPSSTVGRTRNHAGDAQTGAGALRPQLLRGRPEGHAPGCQPESLDVYGTAQSAHSE